MPRDTTAMTRQETSDRFDDNREKLDEGGEALERTTQDVETLRDLHDSLELSGTSEGADAVET